MTTRIVLPIAALALAGCGGSGVSVPDQFAGTWGADCAAPWVRFEPGKVHDFPAKADYPLKAAEFANGELKVTYTRPDMEVTDSYVSEGATLRLTKTVAANGGEAAWNKLPMSKCP